MSAPLTLHELLACGAALLAGLGVATWQLIRRDEEERWLATRVDEFATPYARATALHQMGRRRAALSRVTGLLPAFHRMAGYDQGQARHYPVRAPAVFVLCLVLSLLVSQALSIVVGPVSRLSIPFVVILACRRTFAWFEQRRSDQLYRQFPDALSMIVRSVRVGTPVGEAVRTVSVEALEPTRTEFALLHDQVKIGVALDEALGLMADRNKLPEYRFFATALSLQSQTGGGLSETLENLAEVIRKRVALRNRAYAMASEARASTYILAALPVFAGMAVSILNPSYAALLVSEQIGQAVLAGTVMMLATGMAVMRVIIQRSLRA